LGLPSFHAGHWDPLWQALEETSTVICCHIGSKGSVPTLVDAPVAHKTILVEQNAMSCLVNFLFSSIPERYPDLKFVLSEGGVSWLPSVLARCDRQWEKYSKWESLPAERPSDRYRRAFYGCTTGDALAAELMPLIGVDTVLWECDFPHAESPWPGLQEHVADAFSSLTVHQRNQILSDNASDLFRWGPKHP
jgi:predicted TIM-barrel fold metal-dependent hydrolase